MVTIRKKPLEFTDFIAKLYPELVNRNDDLDVKKLAKVVTFQVTDACNLACTYCYQINKGTRKMSFEVAKKFIDLLLSGEKGFSDYVGVDITPAIVLDFIGGEPLLEVDLIDKIIDYFREKALELDHPWAEKYMCSISSNGTLYFEPNVQKFLEKHRNHLSFSVSIDGNKELHDSCRVFPDGRPSYDLAVAGAMDWMNRGHYMGSKITVAPANVGYVYKASKHMIELGYYDININCVYEKGWTIDHAKTLYEQLKMFADYLLSLDNPTDYYYAFFKEDSYEPLPETENNNWCWGAGTPILTTTGYKPIEDIKIGDFVYTEDGSIHQVINTMCHMADNVVRISASGIFDLVCTDDHKLFVKPFNYNEYGKYMVKDIQHNDLIKLFQLPEGYINYDNSLAYIIGRYIGDGWHSTTGFKICCSHEETEYLKEKLNEANVEYSMSDYPTETQFNILKHNEQLIDILSRCGTCATNKHLPPDCLNWTKESLQSLLIGYMDANGAINKSEQLGFNTISYQLAQDLMLILRTLGFTTTCYKNNHAEESEILGKTVQIQDRYEVYFYKDPTRAKYVHEADDGMWAYGLNILKEVPQLVYNITVDTNHSYVAGGIVSANCGGTGVMLSCDPDGVLYPCIRYMESSLGTDQKPIIIGNVDDGIAATQDIKDCISCLQCITRRSQSTDECFYCPIAKGCSWCFPKGTMINTPYGMTDIADLKIGDLVLDMNGQVQEVENVLSRMATDLVTIKAAGLHDMITTSEHPFLAKKVIKRHHNIPIYSEPMWVRAGDLEVTDKIALYVPRLGNISFNKNLAYLLGRYIGDGWKTPSIRPNPFRYYICCSIEEKEKLEWYLDESLVAYNGNKNKVIMEYYINAESYNSKVLIELLDKCGRYAYDKQVPPEVYTWDAETVNAFLTGYFDADGYFDNRKGQRYTTVSQKLVYQIAELCRAVYHKNVTITERHPDPTTVIEGRTVNQSYSYEGSFKPWDLTRSFYEYDEENNMMWVNVRESILQPPERMQVFNLTVKNNPTFIANGAIVHNCSAYNYQTFGTVDKRATFICEMHKAASLANVYYFNKLYEKYNMDKKLKMHCPKEWAVPIIGEEEYNMLYELQK